MSFWMKKILLLTLVSSIVLFWCAKNEVHTIDVAKIVDLPGLEKAVTQVSNWLNEWIARKEQTQNLVEQLQLKYIDFIGTVNTTDKVVEDQLVAIEWLFNKWSITSYTLPLRAKKLWMTLPQWMHLDKALSQKTTLHDSGYNSTVLVYTWDYTIAMQQAQIVASKAHLSVSKNFQQAQALAKIGSVDYISWLDIGSLDKWIVYINHELLDTNIDNLLSISVDGNGTLTIETTNYNK